MCASINQKLIVHEESYKKKNLVSIIHQQRLKLLHRLFQQYVSYSSESWADFGCSNGFIIEQIVNSGKFQFSKIIGFDHKVELLQLAREKDIPNSEFRSMNLNEIHENIEEKFDVVTCFETLEHVGDYKTAFTNLFNHLGKKGKLIITIPNETFLPGLLKFWGRMAVRRRPYENFFEKQNIWKYNWYLLTNRYIDIFRESGQPGYGPHLGFDYRKFSEHVREKYLATDCLNLIEKRFTGMGMNVVFVFQK